MEAHASIYFLLLAEILKQELQLLTCKEYTLSELRGGNALPVMPVTASMSDSHRL